VRGRDVERLEVVPVVLDLRTLGDAVTEADEDVLELALDLGHEVQVTAHATVRSRGQVEPVAFGRRRRLERDELLAPNCHEVGDRGAVRTDGLPGERAVRRFEVLDGLVDLPGR